MPSVPGTARGPSDLPRTGTGSLADGDTLRALLALAAIALAVAAGWILGQVRRERRR
jgi:hypothetical protein